MMELDQQESNLDTASRLVRIETILGRLEHRLLGNGQPGDLQKFTDRLNDIDDDRARFKGALWVIGTAVTACGGFLAKHLLKW